MERSAGQNEREKGEKKGKARRHGVKFGALWEPTLPACIESRSSEAGARFPAETAMQAPSPHSQSSPARHQPAGEGVFAAFAVECGRFSVSAEDLGLGGQSEQLAQRGGKIGLVAAGQIGAAHASGEQNVAADAHVLRFEIESDAAGRMAGQKQGATRKPADAEDVALTDCFVDGRDFGRGKSEPDRLLPQVFEEKRVAFMSKNRGIEGRFPPGVVVNVVEMAVGVPDRLERNALFFQFHGALEGGIALNRGVDDD